MTSSQTVALVTGASSGVGRATASALAARGYRVFGTSRSPSGDSTPGSEMLPLDVRDDASVAACVAAVTARAERLDLLVNNAGFEQAGALEEVSLEEARAQFETNFFGVVRMVKEVLPGMRSRRSGRIVNLSSFAGRLPIPFLGIYSASKFAVDGYTEALRAEVKPFGIRVSQVEPWFLHTPMMSHRKTAARPIADYDRWRERAFAAIRGYEEKGPGPEAVADVIVKIAMSRRPRLRYLVGGRARFVASLMRFSPEAAFEPGFRSTYRLDRPS
jgi:NAD(P)-dependent dehydrogenase (short-subunit alcohol dehydrogenase family)